MGHVAAKLQHLALAIDEHAGRSEVGHRHAVGFTLGIQLSQAQMRGPVELPAQSVPDVPAAELSDYIPVQGRLTDAFGAPLNGTYSIKMQVYDVPDGGSVLCGNLTTSVTVSNGLFNSTLDLCDVANAVEGNQLYLGVTVGSDPEMTPRQPIYSVPYAMSLKPGAVIGGDLKQVRTGDGLAKAAVYAWCGGAGAFITRSFNNVNTAAITVAGLGSAGQCEINFGFQMNDRYYVGTAINDAAARVVTVWSAPANNQRLNVRRTDMVGTGVDGNIMVVVY